MHLQYIAMLVSDVNYLVDLLLEKEQNHESNEVPILSEIQNMFQTTELPLPSNILIIEGKDEIKITNDFNLETKSEDENVKEMGANLANPSLEQDYTVEEIKVTEIKDYEIETNVEEIENYIPEKMHKQRKWTYIEKPTSIWVKELNQRLLWNQYLKRAFLKNGKK